MFDLGSGELLVIGIVALVVIGPKELPGLLRTIGQTVARVRRIAGDFQGQFQSALREADLHDAMKSVSDIQTSVSDATHYNDPLANLQMPSLPEPVTMPPVELRAPENVQATSGQGDIAPPKAKRAAKPKDTDQPKEDPQAALFDTLDQMNKKAESKPAKSAGEKKPRAVKAKAVSPKPTGTKSSSGSKTKRKSKTDETSS